ncbi:unnamed protein product [Allacma fusca]|uniref:RING-type domain-containing protein n=1 Tax=Allacma fusca TaxID=39272 RepID=A0A8J2KCY3_9HEXA|nr:unnamed protein product [Allacma fusca]
MTVICTICLHGLDTPPEDLMLERRICITECGHIFHVLCLNRWWRSIMSQTNHLQRHYPCPFCRRNFRFPFVFQIYPAFQNPASEPADARIGDLEERNLQLRTRLEIVNRELVSTKAALEELKVRGQGGKPKHRDNSKDFKRDASA